MTLISCQNLVKIYGSKESQVSALRSVSFSVKQGENIAIMGPSGSGKSTLLQLLGCLDYPTSGTYQLNDTDVTSLSDDLLSEFRGKYIGFVFQHFHLLPRLSLVENVALPLFYQHINKEERLLRANTALERVNLAHRSDHKQHQLSGGEKQRGAIARAIVHEPQLILADEPTGNLDSAVKGEILDHLCRLNSDLGVTLIIVTHDDETASRSKRILHLSDGMIVRSSDVGQ